MSFVGTCTYTCKRTRMQHTVRQKKLGNNKYLIQPTNHHNSNLTDIPSALLPNKLADERFDKNNPNPDPNSTILPDIQSPTLLTRLDI